MGYITFNQYKQLGGKSDESSFNLLLIDASAKINKLTSCKFDKFLTTLTTVPQDIQRLLVVTIDVLGNNGVGDKKLNLSSYSNGIESFGFNSTDPTMAVDKEISKLCADYLYNYPEIIYRGVR